MTAPNVNIRIAADYKSAEQQGKQYLAKLEQDFRATMAQVKEDQARGLIDPLKAAQREADALKVKQTAILRDLNDLRTAGQLNGSGGTAFYTTVANGLKGIGENSKGAKLNLEGLIPAFNGLAARALGTEQTFGTLAGTLGQFAVGGAVTGAVLAGVAIIGLAYKALGEQTSQAAKDAEAAAKRIRAAHDEASGQTLAQQIAATDTQVARLQKNLEALRRPIPSAGPTTLTTSGAAQDALRQKQLEREQEIREKTLQLQTLQAEQGRLYRERELHDLGAVLSVEVATNAERERARDLLKQLRAELAQATDTGTRARLAQQIKDLTDAEDAAARTRKKTATEAEKAAEKAAKALGEQANAMHRYTEAAQAAEQADAKRRKAAVEALNDDALDKELKKALKAVGEQARKTREEMAKGAAEARGVVTDAMLEGFDRTLDELHDGPFWRGVARDAGRAISDGVLQGLANGVAGGRAFWESIARLGENILSNTLGKVFQRFATTAVGKTAGTAAATGVAGFDVGTVVGAAASGANGSHATRGALAGSAAGAGTGALIGTAIAPGIGTAIGAVAGSLVGAIGGLIGAHKRAKDAADKMAAAQESLAEQQRNAEANRLGLIGSTNNDLTLRHIAATQGDDAAAAARRQAEQAEEIARLTNGGADQSTIDFARQVQQEENARAEKERQATEAQRQAQAEALAGQQEAAEQARLKALADEAQALKDAAQAEADRIAQVNRSAAEDQELRRLIATGQTDAAEAYRRTLEEQHKIDELVAEGADAATIANERYVDGLEDIAAATAKATQAAKEAAAAQDQLRNSQLGAFGQRNQFLGENSPLDFSQTVALGQQSNPLIAQFLDGVDIGNPDSVIQALTGGFRGIDAGKLHEMTPDEIASFTAALGIAGTIKNARPAIDLGPGIDTTASQPVSTVLGGVTEGTAVRVDDILRSSFAVQVDQLDALRGILGALTPVAPPNLPTLAGGGAGGSTFSPTINVAIERLGGDGGAVGADPRALARAIEGELAALLANPNDVLRVALIQTLGGAVDLRALASGDTTVRRSA
jgi:chemotaxis protein histidine kinase CheA